MVSRKLKNEDLFLRILLIVCWLGIQIYYYNISDKFKVTEITDTDSFTRLVRVEELAKTGDWYDSTIERSNAPYGDTLHWTRPLDILLVAGGWAGTPFWGFSQALLYWGIIINPGLGALALFIFHKIVSPFLDVQGQRLTYILFFSQLSTWETFIIGHPDHHGLMLLLFMIILGLLFRMADESQKLSFCMWGGFAAGVAFWVSVESITVLILVFASMIFFWLREGGQYLKRLAWFNLTLVISLVFFLFLEWPFAKIFTVEYDKISIVHVFVFSISLFTLVLLGKLPQSGIKKRFIGLSAVGVLALFLIWQVYPDFFGGPFVNVNQDIVPIWLSRVQEVQPLTKTGFVDLLSLAGNLVLSFCFLMYYLKHRELTWDKMLIPLVTGLLIFVPLAFYQVRWVRYANIILVLTISPLLWLVMGKISGFKRGLGQRLLRIFAILVFCFGPLAAGLTLDYVKGQEEDTHFEYPPLKPMCLWMGNQKDRIPSDSIILACIDYGPEILYRTNFRVIATPYHRNDEGILFSYRVMNVVRDDEAYKMIQERGVNLILISPDSLEEKFYDRRKEDDTFYSRLIKGEIPSWLRPVKLPPDLAAKFKLFSVSLF